MAKSVRLRAVWISGAVLCCAGLAGLCAPLLAAHVLHFSVDEQHTGLRFAPPGTRDVSLDFPSWDADEAAFSILDRDGDGELKCRARAEFARLTCPEIDRFAAFWRTFDLLIDLHDRDGDGRLSRSELPQRLVDVDDRIRPLHWRDAEDVWRRYDFDVLDRDGDRGVDRSELIAATRLTRLTSASVLQRDYNGDGALQKAEFPGVPQLHTFWLGTDDKGRDLLVRLLFGARMSLLVGLLATTIALLIGVTWGCVAGYLGGRVDNLMMRIVDTLYGLPFMFIVILLLVVAGRSTTNLFIALGAVSWLNMSRIVRGQVRSVRKREYVVAARAMGASTARILIVHILPSALGPILVAATLLIPAVIMEEALLSFLGLGVQPPGSSWGTLIADGAGRMADHPWLIAWPAATLALTLLACNFLGDGLRDVLDR